MTKGMACLSRRAMRAMHEALNSQAFGKLNDCGVKSSVKGRRVMGDRDALKNGSSLQDRQTC